MAATSKIEIGLELVSALFVRLPEVPFTLDEVWFVIEELVHPYALDKLGKYGITNVAVRKTAMPVDMNNLFMFIVTIPVIKTCYRKAYLTLLKIKKKMISSGYTNIKTIDVTSDSNF